MEGEKVAEAWQPETGRNAGTTKFCEERFRSDFATTRGDEVHHWSQPYYSLSTGHRSPNTGG